MADNDVIAMLITRKFDEYMPTHHLHRQFLREQGVDLPVSTLCDWVASGASNMHSWCKRMQQEYRCDTLGQNMSTVELFTPTCAGLKMLSNASDGQLWANREWLRPRPAPPIKRPHGASLLLLESAPRFHLYEWR